MRLPNTAAKTAASRACVLAMMLVFFIAGGTVFAEEQQARRVVTFPPAEAPPPPPVKSIPKMQTSSESTSIAPHEGPDMRKTQERRPAPPTTLTILCKLEYGETLEYVHPNGRVQRFDQWRSYINDASSLVRATNERLNDGLNYQYMTRKLSAASFDPVDIPILFMAGDYDFTFTDREVDHLRKYVMNGGTILFNAARGRNEFTAAVAREMKRVFPEKRFMPVPRDHALFSSRYRITRVLTMVNGVQFQQEPEIYSIDIGTRAAAILIPGGMGTAWSGERTYHPAGKHIIGESAIRLGVNVIAYTLGCTEYGKFLAQEFPQYSGKSGDGDAFRFALVAYAGSWDVNPAIQNPVTRTLHDETKQLVQVDRALHRVTLDEQRIGEYPLIFMTGHYDFQLNDREVETLRAYFGHGGTLVATAAAGLKPFDTAFRREIKRVLPKGEFVKLTPSHPIFTSTWAMLNRVEYTPAALRDHPELEYPELWGVFVDERLVVIYSPWDLMSGVNRESNGYAKGLHADDATRLVLNIVTHTLSN